MLEGHQGRVLSVAFHPKGRTLVSAGEDKVIRLWGAASGTFFILSGHAWPVTRLAFSADGRALASLGMGGMIHMWDVGTWKPRWERLNVTAVFDGLFSPDGRTLATAHAEDQVRFWDRSSGRPLAVLRGHRDGPSGLAFSPDGKRLLTAQANGDLLLWDVAARTSRAVPHAEGTTHVDFHPDGRRIAYGRKRIHIRDLESGTVREIGGLKREINRLRFSPDGKLLAAACAGEPIRLWDLETGRPLWRGPLLRPDSTELYSHRGWERLDGRPLGEIRKGGWRAAVAERARLADEHAQKGYLCLGTYDDRLELWDVEADQLLASRPAPGIQSLFAGPGGCYVLTGDGQANGSAVGQLGKLPPGGELRAVADRVSAASLDGEELLVAGPEGIFRLTPEEGPIGPSRPPEGVTALARIGAHLAIGHQDGAVQLVPLEPGAHDAALLLRDTEADRVWLIRPGPPGTVIVAHAGGLVGLWSLETGSRLLDVRLIGVPRFAVLRGDQLYLATDLGDHRVLDLSVFSSPHCKLLRRVWREVPAVFEGDRLVRRAPPHGHPCAQ
jgi:WD40 repeat protein